MSLPAGDGLFHASLKYGQRSAGKSAVAAAAYRAACRLDDDRLGRVYDYSRKSHLVRSEILAPPGAPAWTQDREAVWNRAEAAERRKDAVIWRELELSLPRGLSHEQHVTLVHDLVRPYIDAGAVADCCYHRPVAADKLDNPHVHILLTMRALDNGTESGFAARKNAGLEATFESGGRAGGRRGDALKAERERWAGVINRHLVAAGAETRVDHRSHRDRGLDREPEPQMPAADYARWKRGGGRRPGCGNLGRSGSKNGLSTQ